MGKLFKFIGAVVVLAALAVGGYFVYKQFIEKNVGEFQIVYKYEQLIEGYGDKNVYVTGYKGVSPEDVVIPSFYDVDGTNRPVKGIKGNAFKDNKNMKTIDIPEACDYFGGYIFRNCTSLNTINLRALYISGFDTCLETLDASTITINVVNDAVKTSVLNAYPTANVNIVTF